MLYYAEEDYLGLLCVVVWLIQVLCQQYLPLNSKNMICPASISTTASDSNSVSTYVSADWVTV